MGAQAMDGPCSVPVERLEYLPAGEPAANVIWVCSTGKLKHSPHCKMRAVIGILS